MMLLSRILSGLVQPIANATMAIDKKKRTSRMVWPPMGRSPAKLCSFLMHILDDGDCPCQVREIAIPLARRTRPPVGLAANLVGVLHWRTNGERDNGD